MVTFKTRIKNVDQSFHKLYRPNIDVSIAAQTTFASINKFFSFILRNGTQRKVLF